ncbi:ribosomal protein S18 acetylase RimI-like enzyme [Chitinophaga skermanii]|uniref:Ribosomal protein S18 acetylase RimI-like enzyme n=1 Tax=Chitinophaga skermanii TaxID=331697 RepID=A0A327QMP6_9BACT|nr:GNAT family N-acetyltransferase [Chitinophaga skermanii]RAJ05145.1 ribosomal protein S18 acetylase RimI-like enzyme [Chitinophaga skermanii]
MIRIAHIADIPVLERIRLSVKENVLSNPNLVTRADYTRFLTVDGKGWVDEQDHIITGFAVIDTTHHNIWALFVDPGFEQQGIGKQLQNTMLHWHFTHSNEMLWLTTAKDSRAAEFYRRTGWREVGETTNGKELRFEMYQEDWLRHG